MGVYLTTEKKNEIFREFGGSEKNTGSAEAQVALFTYRIQELSKHLQTNRKDHACRKSLLSLVGKRRQLLQYISKKNIETYRSLIEKLGIRK
jgi:small subunit ribosomal protein S15